MKWQVLRTPWQPAQAWEQSFPPPEHPPSSDVIDRIMRAVMRLLARGIGIHLNAARYDVGVSNQHACIRT